MLGIMPSLILLAVASVLIFSQDLSKGGDRINGIEVLPSALNSNSVPLKALISATLNETCTTRHSQTKLQAANLNLPYTPAPRSFLQEAV